MAGKGNMIRPKKCNIVLVGESGVGKTKLIGQFCFSAFVDYDDPFICEDYIKQILLHNRVAYLDIAEPIGPVRELLSMWEYQMRNADAALLVYSITSLQSFERVSALWKEASALTGPAKQGGGDGELGSRGRRPIPICLVGNKSDCKVSREVSVEAGAQLAKELGCSFFETSAKDGTNVDEAFYTPLRAVDKDPTDDQEPVAVV
ncbi:hypothetical protein VE03_05465 [Pseudogymnoascus sp. 23342-1-I1]|nr:hypothetical protein VE03_05465 [Pseudogymnoascus sp. 23342-1-I1]